MPDILDGGGIYVSPNAGPSNFAGKECHKNYFVVSWQNDTLHESAGQNATNLGYKKAFILAPNYQAGKDALAGFKRFFKGEIIGEPTRAWIRPIMRRKWRKSAPRSLTSSSTSIRAVSASRFCGNTTGGTVGHHSAGGRGAFG